MIDAKIEGTLGVILFDGWSNNKMHYMEISASYHVKKCLPIRVDLRQECSSPHATCIICNDPIIGK